MTCVELYFLSVQGIQPKLPKITLKLNKKLPKIRKCMHRLIIIYNFFTSFGNLLEYGQQCDMRLQEEQVDTE